MPEGRPSAGMIVVSASQGGTFRETLAIGKAYVEARKQHGASELLDEIVSARPEMDHTRYRSVEELRQHGLQHASLGGSENVSSAAEPAP